MKCCICNKVLGNKDHCSAVSAETFPENKGYWEDLHNRFGIHFIRVNPQTLVYLKEG